MKGSVEEKILTRHPLGKRGLNVSKRKYETVRRAILAALRRKPLTHTELVAQLRQGLERTFSGNVSWYAETVKLDLEARGRIERTTSRPQRYRLKIKRTRPAGYERTTP